jgi:regulator of sigma E protease
MPESENLKELPELNELSELNEPSEPKGRGKRFYSQLAWLGFILVLAAIVIIRYFGVFTNILLAIIGLGLMILVHEFGHFVMAKLSDIHVEAFSIGFPPILFGIRRSEEGYKVRVLPSVFPSEKKEEELEEGIDEWDDGQLHFTFGKKGRSGETEYRVGLIPFGGFVKMLGQEDMGKVKSSDDPRSYGNRPVSKRMAVISAGVCFNVVSAIIIFMIVFLAGINMPPPVVGGINPGTPAAKAGLRGGDEIIEINGKGGNLDFTDVRMAAALSNKGQAVELKVRREDGSIEEVSLVAEVLEGSIEGVKAFGIPMAQTLTIEEVSEPEALFKRTGLKKDDIIRQVHGEDVATEWEMEEKLLGIVSPSVKLGIERKGKPEPVEVEVPLSFSVTTTKPKRDSDLNHIYSMVPRLKVAAITKGIKGIKYEKDSIKLQEGDIISSIGGIDNPTFIDMRNVTEEYKDKTLTLNVLRINEEGREQEVEVRVIPKEDISGKVLIGIVPALNMEHTVVSKTIEVEGMVDFDIPAGARIVAVDGAAVSDFGDIVREIQRYPNERITIDYRVNEEIAGSVSLEVGDGREFIKISRIGGVDIPLKVMERLYKASGPIDAISMGFKKTMQFVVQTYLTLRSVIGGQVGAGNLKGPIGIIHISYHVISKYSLIDYLYVLGLISACISVINFLPMLPFDGGHLVFLLAEKVKGSPVNERIQMSLATVGWVLVAALALYVTFNDIVKLITGEL